MLKRLIAKVLRGLLSKVEGSNNVYHIQNVTNTEKVNDNAVSTDNEIIVGKTKNGGTEYIIKADKKREVRKTLAQMNRDEYEKYLRDSRDNITAQIMAKGYKEIPNILAEYEVEVVEYFVMQQLISLGMWSKEADMLEGMNKQQLIDSAVQYNYEQFKNRMIESGQAGISDNQKKLVNTLIEKMKEVNPAFQCSYPTNRFEASDLIDMINAKLGVKPRETNMIGNITENQYKAILRLSAKLGVEVQMPNSIKDASAVIEALNKEANNRGLNKASTKQVEYVKRLLKLTGKRWTAKREEKFSNMTVQEISVAINELKAQCPEETNISEGQIRFIKDLCRQMNLPIPADLNKYDKQTATRCISKLRRDFFYIQCKANGTYISREEIAKLSDETIKKMLRQFKMEKDTDNYQRTPQEVEEITGTMDF